MTNEILRSFVNLPLDIVAPIVEHLEDRNDIHTCTLVSRGFNGAATSFLYRSLSSSWSSPGGFVKHPANTILRRPELAAYVQRIKENGAYHGGSDPVFTNDVLKALALCTNLYSLTWIETTASDTTNALLKFLDVVKALPMKEIHIKTHADVGEPIWSRLITLGHLERLSIWCLAGPPRILHGWLELLGRTLTHLELGVGSFLYPCTELISQLPLIRDLRLKGAPASSISTILTYLPNLCALDTEFIGFNEDWHPSVDCEEDTVSPSLSSLTVRTNMDPSVWQWIKKLVPHPGLQTLKIHGYVTFLVRPTLPRTFVLEMGMINGNSLQSFIIVNVVLSLMDVECICDEFSNLQRLECTVAPADSTSDSVKRAVSSAKSLRRLRMTVLSIPTSPHGGTLGFSNQGIQFSAEDAQELMLWLPHLRWISIDSVVYEGKWVFHQTQNKGEEVKFDVTCNIEKGWYNSC